MSTTELGWFKSSYSSGDGDDCVEVALDWRKSTYSSGSGDSCVEVAHSWRKATYSGSSGDDCVEVAECWAKSSYSSAQGDSCIEVATTPATIHIRDSKNKTGPQLTLSPSAWGDFVAFAGRGGRSLPPSPPAG
ncbi:DUF397 domain-containing protein [Streptomyces violascens]|uniref:DUF397 domain-containing protein n=1 Tax=Streptomyces violascens TaxID=67381 RepID=UPI0037986406